MQNADAFILIGGRSTRLGRDKAFVELGGRTLLERAVHTLQPEFERITIVAGNSLQFATQSIAADVPFVFDLYEGRGPLGGLHSALAHAESPWIFVLACDYPFISSDLIRLLSEKISDDFGAVVPEQSDGRLQPLCAFYDAAKARPIVEEVLQRPRVPPPMHEIVSQLTPRIVRFTEYSDLNRAPELFLNINFEEDLARARGLLL